MNTNDHQNLKQDELKQLINAQTAKISWQELQRPFAHGDLICVSQELDLVEVACAMIKDEQQQFNAWQKSNQLNKASDEDALRWQENQNQFWAVVVKPWVLVQEIHVQGESNN